jgi:hypothetical protein
MNPNRNAAVSPIRRLYEPEALVGNQNPNFE